MPGFRTGPGLGLVFGHDLRSSDWKPHLDANLREIDGLLGLAVLGTIGQDTPPGAPVNGDRYITGAAPTGAWAGQPNKVALFENGTWAFYTPREGWLAWAAVADAPRFFNGTSWIAPPSDLSGNNTAQLAEGSNLYYTEGRVSANASVAAATAHVASTANPHATTQAQAAAAGGLAVQSFTGAGPHNPAAGTDVAFVAGGSGAVVLNIPAAAGRTGRAYWIKKTTTDLDPVTVTPAAGLIEGAATLVLGSLGRDQVILVSDGTDYHILGRTN